MSRKQHYAVIWRETDEAPTWSTYFTSKGSVKSFDYKELDLDVEIDRIVDLKDIDLLKPENHDRVTGMRLAVTSDVATKWLGWQLDD